MTRTALPAGLAGSLGLVGSGGLRTLGLTESKVLLGSARLKGLGPTALAALVPAKSAGLASEVQGRTGRGGVVSVTADPAVTRPRRLMSTRPPARPERLMSTRPPARPERLMSTAPLAEVGV